MKKAKQRLTPSPKANLEPKPLITTRNHFPVSIAESRAIWLKSARPPQPDVPSATGLEEDTNRDAPRDRRSKEPASSGDQGSRTIQGMSFDEAKAFFYDMHDVTDKGKAKAL